jgi:hypothetical protein
MIIWKLKLVKDDSNGAAALAKVLLATNAAKYY